MARDVDEFDPWWRDALCAELGSDLFFVAEGQSVLEAKKACQLCPVRVKCLADSLETDVEYGIFGGMARPMRRMLALQMELSGKDAMTVARRAINEERDPKPRSRPLPRRRR